jgi:DNA-binding GntR family transcriptional regulator
MGVSRGPVREAILALEQEGLATSEHRRGSYVCEVDVQSYSELIDLRILLETHAARTATTKCTAESWTKLQHIIDQMRVADQAGDIDSVVDHDLDFHRTICQLSGNRLLARIWEQLAGRLRLAILLSIEHGFDASTMIETHPPVLEAMKCGDGDLAAKLLNERTWEAAERIMAILAHTDVVAEQVE